MTGVSGPTLDHHAFRRDQWSVMAESAPDRDGSRWGWHGAVFHFFGPVVAWLSKQKQDTKMVKNRIGTGGISWNPNRTVKGYSDDDTNMMRRSRNVLPKDHPNRSWWSMVIDLTRNWWPQKDNDDGEWWPSYFCVACLSPKRMRGWFLLDNPLVESEWTKRRDVKKWTFAERLLGIFLSRLAFQENCWMLVSCFDNSIIWVL